MSDRPFETTLEFHVKSYDVDFVGYVHNIVYFRWLEDLRTAMLASCYPLERCLNEGFSPILTHSSIHYVKPLRLFDTFTGHVWVSGLGGVRWEVQHELRTPDETIATAEQSGIFINLESHRPVAVPAGLMSTYDSFLS